MRYKLSVLLILSLFFIFACGDGLKAPEQDEDSTTGNDSTQTDEKNDISVDADIEESVCGDEIVTGSEVCDGNLELCSTIDPTLYKAGKAYCKDDCSGFNTVTCEEVPQECGNSIIEGAEICDGGTQKCSDYDSKYGLGTVDCASDCLSWDTSDCVEVNAVCGDKTVEGDEVCDGGSVNCRAIDADRFVGGLALCKDDCSAWDTVTCEEKSDYDATPDEDTPLVDEDTTIVDEDTTIVDEDTPLVDEDVTCTDNCETIGAKRCRIDAEVEECQMEGGCKVWKPSVDCADTGRFCHDLLVVGDETTENVRNTVLKGNYIQATTAMNVRSFDMMLNVTTEQRLTWVIYEADTKTGTYTLIFRNDVEHPGTGKKFYNSGLLFKDAMPFATEVGKYYLFGVAWENDLTSYYHSYYTFQSENVLFGVTEGGTAEADSWPAPNTKDDDPGPNTYLMRFDADNTADDICECINDCDTPNEEQCNGNTIQECLADATYGCLSWTNQNDCSSHSPSQICSASGGTASCKNDCVDTCPQYGDKQCDGRVVQMCDTGVKGCLEWQLSFDCETQSKYCSQTGTNAYCVDASAPQIDYVGDTNNEGTNPHYLKLNFFQANKNVTLTGLQMLLKHTGTSATVTFRIYESTSESGTYTKIASEGVAVSSTTATYIGPTDFNISITSGRYYAVGIWIGSEEVTYYYDMRSSPDYLPDYETGFADSILGNLSSNIDYPTSFTGKDIFATPVYRMKLIYNF